MTQDRPRRLAAVWFADIVGYTDLSARDEDLALRVVRELQRIAKKHCGARGGRVVKLMGDAVLTVFDSVDGAVRAAIALRDEFLGSDEAKAGEVSIRIGVHLGEVVDAPDGDVYGDAVNVASRIERVAEPGQVVISQMAYFTVQQRTAMEADDLGEFELKGLPGPVRLYGIRLVGEAETQGLRELLQEAIAPLQLLDVKGMGGMGEIYLARDPGLRRTLAVKVLKSELVADSQARTRFQREATVIAGLSHPNVITIHSVGELKDETPYFVMDYIEGGSLADRLEQEGPLSVPETRRILGEVASALQAAHAKGIVHRDIKAANVLWDLESGRALVTDWGIAALDPTVDLAPETRLTKTGVFIGSPQYMSPEQLAGDEVGPETDIYSLGLLAFELLTSQGPFSAETPREIMISHLREDPPRISASRGDVDSDLTDLIDRCLAKEPANRPTAVNIVRSLRPGEGARIEWPPPGLEPLRGLGAEASAYARRAGVVAAMSLGLWYAQPATASGRWLEGETSWFWKTVWVPVRVLDELFLRPTECRMSEVMGLPGGCITPIDAAPLWQFGLTVLFWFLLYYFACSAERVLVFFLMSRRARKVGYSARTLFATAWDRGPETGDLLSGMGAFAFLDEVSRRALMAGRLRAELTSSVLLALAPLLPITFVLGWWPGSAGLPTSHWLTPMETIVCLGPIAFALVLRKRILSQEPRSRKGSGSKSKPAPIRRRSTYRLAKRWGETALPQTELVRAWRTQGGDEASEFGGTLSAAAITGGSVLAPGLFVMVFAVGLGLVYFSTMWTSVSLREMGSDFVEFVEVPFYSQAQWASLDSAVHELTLEIADPSLDVTALWDTLTGHSDPAIAEALRLESAESSPDSSNDEGESPEMRLWRFLGSGWAAIPPGTQAPKGVRPPRSSFRATAERLQDLASESLERGDTASARDEILRQLSAARFMLASVDRSNHRIGPNFLQSGVRLLGLASQPRDARRFRAMADRVGLYSASHRAMWIGFEEILLVDPVAPRPASFVADRRLAPAVRLALARATLTGMCSNGREITLGLSDGRLGLFREALGMISDLPPEAAEDLRRFRGQSLEVLGERRGVWGIPARLKWCSGHWAG